jgi:DNA-binding transcriptional regulator GbsR (MarR family)
MEMLKSRFNGPVYDPAADKDRLTRQIGRIYQCMIDGRWRTLEEISQITGDGESSISAQLRHLRKPKFGAYKVFRRPRGDRKHGLFEYSVAPKEVPAIGSELFEQEILQDLTKDFFTGPVVH